MAVVSSETVRDDSSSTHLVLERFQHGCKGEGAQDDVLHSKQSTVGSGQELSARFQAGLSTLLFINKMQNPLSTASL